MQSHLSPSLKSSASRRGCLIFSESHDDGCCDHWNDYTWGRRRRDIDTAGMSNRMNRRKEKRKERAQSLRQQCDTSDITESESMTPDICADRGDVSEAGWPS